MRESFTFFVYTLTSLFTIANPLGAIPFFNALTDQVGNNVKKQVAFRVATAALISMIFFTVSGKFLFEWFNISLDGLRIVGGILFFISGYDMLQGKQSRTKSPDEDDQEELNLLAVTPLAIPIICGPGTITVLNVLYQESQTRINDVIIFVSIVLVCLSVYFIMVFSRRILNLLGTSGSKVLSRIMGLIIMMIAVEFFFTGLTPYVRRLVGGS